MKLFLFTSLFLFGFVSLACPPTGLKAGDRVFDTLVEKIGTVHETFENGKVSIRFDDLNFISTRGIENLSKSTDCLKNFCKKSRIIHSMDKVGTLKEIFENGKAAVHLDHLTQSTVVITEIEALGKGYRCIERVCRDTRLIHSPTNSPVTVVELFDNGKALVKFSNIQEPQVMSFDSLGIKLGCSLRKDCTVQD